jgi:RTX calcium-binding nonapeptide repeat (4 copies)
MFRTLMGGALLVAAVCAATALGPGAQASGTADHPTKCFGEKPDQNRWDDPGGSFLALTPHHDVVIASNWGDHIEGWGGRDYICALNSIEGDPPDEVHGGKGADKLNGGRGRDDIRGGAGNDLLKGGRGRDHGRGGAGFDTCVSIEVPTSCEVIR